MYYLIWYNLVVTVGLLFVREVYSSVWRTACAVVILTYKELLAFGFRIAVSFEIELQEKHEVAEVEADSNGRVTVGIPTVVPIPLPVQTVEVNEQPHKHLQRLHRGNALG